MRVLIKKGVKEIIVNDYQAEMLLRVAPRDYSEKIEPVTVRADIIELSEDMPERVYPDIIPDEVRTKRGRPAKAKE